MSSSFLWRARSTSHASFVTETPADLKAGVQLLSTVQMTISTTLAVVRRILAESISRGALGLARGKLLGVGEIGRARLDSGSCGWHGHEEDGDDCLWESSAFFKRTGDAHTVELHGEGFDRVVNWLGCTGCYVFPCPSLSRNLLRSVA